MKKTPKQSKKIADILYNTFIPVEVHKEYIGYHNKIDLNELSSEKLKEERNKILKKKTPLELKKKILFLLAHNKSLWALYGIQKYLKDPDLELTAWAVIAWQECQSGVLGSALEKLGLDDNEGLIMGALGGDGSKRLRYCFALSAEKGDFSKTDIEKIKLALQSASLEMKSETEEVIFSKNYLRVTVSVSIDVAIGEFIERVIEFSNTPKPFLRRHYFVVNTHILSKEEIEEYIAGLQKS